MTDSEKLDLALSKLDKLDKLDVLERAGPAPTWSITSPAPSSTITPTPLTATPGI